MALATLNADVLCAACQFLTDISDVLSFSLTCSSLRPVATQRLLSISSIRLTNGASIHKFHSFLFADAPARAPYVRTVQIAWGSEAQHQPTSDDEVSLLIYILSSCPNLESIRICVSKSVYSFGPPVFSHRPAGDPRIVEAIGTLQNLHELSMDGWSEETPALLCAIRAPLRVLRLQCGDHRWESVPWWDPARLESILLHLAPTLEELEIGDAIAPPLSAIKQFPSVRSLTIGCIVGRPLLDRLQHSFPELQGTLCIRNFSMEDLSGDTYADTRAAKKAARRNNRRLEDPAPAPAWTKLDRLVCHPDVFSKLAAALRCPVGLVMLRRVSTETRHFVTIALCAHPVRRLQLELELLGGLGVLDPGLFPPELAGTLTHLTLVFKYANKVRSRSERGADPHPLAHLQWHDVFNRTLSALQPLHSLTHLRLVISTDICHVLHFLPAHSEPFVSAVRGSMFDFAGTVAALLYSHPFLQYLFIQTDGHLSNYGEWNTAAKRSVYEEWHEAKGWCVVREEAGTDDPEMQEQRPMLIELADAVVETIVWREQLFASEAEEESLGRGRS
ncbi:hypothetical protein V8D89_014326 [Ganoderma adspersum]